jgi:hypothetical protein
MLALFLPSERFTRSPEFQGVTVEEERWVFNFLGNVAIQLNGEQKKYVLFQMQRFLELACIGIIELEAEDGSAVGFRSDSVVAWTKVLTLKEASAILPVSGLVRAA